MTPRDLASYVLTCPLSADRLPAFERRWKETRPEAFGVRPFKVVWGMNAERFPRSPFWRVGMERTELPDRQTGNGLDRRGHTACYWGHVQEWRAALGENDTEFETGAACFFEDDAELDPDFWERVSAALSELPPAWDLLYFGGELCVHGRPLPPVFSANLYKVDNVNRTHAYCVRFSSLPKIILWFEENREWGHNFRDKKTGASEAEVDYALGALTESGFLTGYALRRWAAGQAAGFSWTQGRTESSSRRWQK